MAFVVAHRHSGVTRLRGRSMLRAGRLLMKKLCAGRNLTPQERANMRASMPRPAIYTASLGAHPPVMTSWS